MKYYIAEIKSVASECVYRVAVEADSDSEAGKFALDFISKKYNGKIHNSVVHEIDHHLEKTSAYKVVK